MKEHKVGIIMNGVTGRMGSNQHLLRSIVAIRDQGGIRINEEEKIIPHAILVGRNEEKLKSLCKRSGFNKWTTDLDKALSSEEYQIYFDAQVTDRRFEAVSNAIKAGKHIYCEKPSGANLGEALELYQLANEAGIKHGVVQDKLWLPGLLKVKKLVDEGFFGKILSIRGEFGYWVFEGHTVPPNRPSWNYRKEDGGSIIVDMFCHWRYVLDNIFGKVKAVSCIGATHILERLDESGKAYEATADDAAYATFELDGDIIAHFNSSWTVRVRRDDLLTLQIDGTKGSAVAGLRDCYIQDYNNTPIAIWNPDGSQGNDYYNDWKKAYPAEKYDNAFRVQWELFLKHIVMGTPFPNDLLEGAKGIQLAEAGLESWKKRKWIDLQEIL